MMHQGKECIPNGTTLSYILNSILLSHGNRLSTVLTKYVINVQNTNLNSRHSINCNHKTLKIHKSTPCTEQTKKNH